MKENTDRWIQLIRKRMEEAPVPYDPLQGWERMEQKILSYERAVRRRKGAFWIATSFVAAAAVWLLFMILDTDVSYTNGRLIHMPVLQSKAPEIVMVVSNPKQLKQSQEKNVHEQERKEITKIVAQDKVAETHLSKERGPVQEEAVHKEAHAPKEVLLMDEGPRQKIQKKRITLSASGLLAMQDKGRAVAVNRENIYVFNKQMLRYATTQRVNTTSYTGEAVFISSGYNSYEYKHKFPISFAVYAALSLGDRWAVESGLRASRVASGIYMVSDRQAVPIYISDQILWYIGVPIRLRLDFIKSRYVTAYASAGGALDKCISFSYTKTLDNTDLRYASYDIPLQWSVHATAGIQYNITQTIGLFAEPGIGFFFGNESPVGTFWQEKPVHFQLNAGMRFSF